MPRDALCFLGGDASVAIQSNTEITSPIIHCECWVNHTLIAITIKMRTWLILYRQAKSEHYYTQGYTICMFMFPLYKHDHFHNWTEDLCSPVINTSHNCKHLLGKTRAIGGLKWGLREGLDGGRFSGQNRRRDL